MHPDDTNVFASERIVKMKSNYNLVRNVLHFSKLLSQVPFVRIKMEL